MNFPLWKIHWRGKKIKQSLNWNSLNTPSRLHVHPHSALWIVSATSNPNGHSITECHSGSLFAWKRAKTEPRKNKKKSPYYLQNHWMGVGSQPAWRKCFLFLFFNLAGIKRYHFRASSSHRPSYWITCLIACLFLPCVNLCLTPLSSEEFVSC